MNISPVAHRFAEEWGRVREALELNQAAMAREMDVSREGARKFEKGLAVPGGEVLAKAAILGFDVQYVLLGVRSANLGEAVPEVNRAAVTAPGSQHININGGSGHVVSQGGPVNVVQTAQYTQKTVAEVKPGAEHIDDRQAAKLQELVNQVVEREGQVKLAPKTHRAVWAALNKHCKVPKYRLIKLGDYERAETYLRRWLGRLGSAPSAPAKVPEHRKNRYAAIKINIPEPELGELLQQRYGVSSLSDLEEDELNRIYQLAMRRRRASKKAAN